MTNGRKPTPPKSARRDVVRPRSPSEALEPGRAPPRPAGLKPRRENRALGGFVRALSSVLTVVVAIMVALGGTTLLVSHLYDRPGPLAYSQTVVIPKGAGNNEIAERLEHDGVISSRWAFMVNYYFQSRFVARELVFKHGEYMFKQGASLREVMDTLSSGKAILYKVTVPEGLTSYQIVQRLKAEANLTGEVDQIPAEGALMPDTYSIEKGMTRQDLLLRMQAKQKQFLESAWERRSPDSILKSPDEAVALASVVEKETGRADERARIAGVFTNRLVKGMMLQSDPTILYGVFGGEVQWGKPIMQTEKDAKNGHNTYQMKGLPQTPICNPGRPAIEAALNPAKTEDLFFVADGTGGHIFTATYKDHSAAVQDWRKLEKEMRAKQEAKKAAAEGGAPVADDAIPNPPAEGATAVVPVKPADAVVPGAAPAAVKAAVTNTGKATAKAAGPTPPAGTAPQVAPPVRKPKQQ